MDDYITGTVVIRNLIVLRSLLIKILKKLTGLKALLYFEGVGMKGWDGQSPPTPRHQKGKEHTVPSVMDKVNTKFKQIQSTN